MQIQMIDPDQFNHVLKVLQKPMEPGLLEDVQLQDD
jgi:hypothetical protein